VTFQDACLSLPKKVYWNFIEPTFQWHTSIEKIQELTISNINNKAAAQHALL
jgi:hypothetical protein